MSEYPPSKYREKCLANKPAECAVCGETDGLVVHHADGNRGNNELDNLVPLCDSHHRDVHAKRDNVSELANRLRNGTRGGEGDNTTIMITDETWRELNRRKDPGQTFDDVIREAVGMGADA